MKFGTVVMYKRETAKSLHGPIELFSTRDPWYLVFQFHSYHKCGH